jgi:hypothetical protein
MGFVIEIRSKCDPYLYAPPPTFTTHGAGERGRTARRAHTRQSAARADRLHDLGGDLRRQSSRHATGPLEMLSEGCPTRAVDLW